jgi:hypothetical protein
MAVALTNRGEALLPGPPRSATASATEQRLVALELEAWGEAGVAFRR